MRHRDEVYLTWPNNQSIDSDATGYDGTLGGIYDYYMNLEGFERRNLASLRDYSKRNFSLNSKSVSIGQFVNLWLMILPRRVSWPKLLYYSLF